MKGSGLRAALALRFKRAKKAKIAGPTASDQACRKKITRCTRLGGENLRDTG